MNLRGAKRRKTVDRGFILSDHADWSGLIEAIKATEANRIYVTHGYKSSFAKYLNEQGYEAHEVDTLWEGEVVEENLE
jgi:putative mRNA 3-end processing factor